MRFARLCQGWCKSSTIYCFTLSDNLEPLVLPEKRALLQNGDGILIASETRERCVKAALALLTHLGKQGH